MVRNVGTAAERTVSARLRPSCADANPQPGKLSCQLRPCFDRSDDPRRDRIGTDVPPTGRRLAGARAGATSRRTAPVRARAVRALPRQPADGARRAPGTGAPPSRPPSARVGDVRGPPHRLPRTRLDGPELDRDGAP